MTRTLTPAAKARKAEGRTEEVQRRWDEWKQRATPALRRHAEAVERCSLCALPLQRVAQAFMAGTAPQRALFLNKPEQRAYNQFKKDCPDRGTRAAEFAAVFRAEHRHGPSAADLCDALWPGRRQDMSSSRRVRLFIVHRLLENGWLVNAPPVPWTLHPAPVPPRPAEDRPRSGVPAARAEA
ncbi:hypothetical protein [Streptomyces luteireticuli]|uniref:Uncharacterized protein n=1 Tax=Streptomyces luteireticuli TaxID=173858 RepID=A0ABN0Z3W8_9ACTN